jgi:hypothetical protein
MKLKDRKAVSGPQFGHIIGFFSVQKPFHTKIQYVSYKHFDGLKDAGRIQEAMGPPV